MNSQKRTCLQQEVLAGKYTNCWEKCNSNYAPNTSIMNGNNYISPYQKLFNEQKYKEAISFYHRIEKTPLMGSMDFYQYAYCLHVTDTNIPKAIELYSDAYQRGFSKFWICYNRADAYIRINELDKAKKDIREAYELDPDHDGIKMLYKKYILSE